ncbi:MAG: hypothetical protein KatS3mg096_742 [Candidatus Parcubacteria bacterium]|nr:MAG: hypothetical protein KatS3mg096_742 [Candidatus Parcubacteria bacterium]
MPLGYFKQRGRVNVFWGNDPSIFLYLPLDRDHKDYSGKTSATLNGSLRFNNLGFRTPLRSTYFNGNAANYISIADNSFTNPNTLSWVCWFKADYKGSNQGFIFAKRVFDGNIDYLLLINQFAPSRDISFQYHDSGGAYHRYTVSQQFDEYQKWNFIAGTYTFGQGNSIKIWKNGQLKLGTWDTGNGNGAKRDTIEPIQIGRQASSFPGPLLGYLSELALFSRPLTTEEVQEYYRWATSQPKKYWFFPSPPSQGNPTRRLLIMSM